MDSTRVAFPQADIFFTYIMNERFLYGDSPELITSQPVSFKFYID